MTKLSPIIYLKETLPEESWPWVIPALRQDPVVWASLQDQEFLNLSIAQIGHLPKRWTPLNLALNSLGVDTAIQELGTLPLEEISPYLHQQAAKAYEIYTSEDPPTLDLRQAGLLALYFSEHNTEAKLTGPVVSLGCLFSILPEPVEVLSLLNPETAVHTVLANPLPPDEQVAIFNQLVETCDTECKLALLKCLSSQRSAVAAQVARDLLVSDPAGSLTTASQHSNALLLQALSALLTEAEYLAIADKPTELLDKVVQVWSQACDIQTTLAVGLVEQEIATGNLERAHEQWGNINTKVTPEQTAGIILSLAQQGYQKEILTWFDAETSTSFEDKPDQALAQGYIALYHDDQDRAMGSAQQALDGFKGSDSQNLAHVHLLTRLFLDLNLPQEAIKTVNLSLPTWPNDLDLISLLRDSLQAAGQKVEAIQAAHLAVALQPDDLGLRRELAHALETACQWSQALHERGIILSRQCFPEEESTYQDAYLFAACALKADHPQNTASICQKILKHNPKEPEAHRLLGEAYIAMGDHKKARVHFIKATQLAPGSALSWLALAEIYRLNNQKSKRLETLQAATNAVPENPEIFLALGEVFLDDDAPTQALNAFRTADYLAKNGNGAIAHPIQSSAALALGKTLHQLGHTMDARMTLETAYDADREHMGIAHAYARALIATDLPERAIPILDNARKKASDEVDIHLDYAKACLAADSNLDETRDTLVEILETQPDHAEAKGFLAEAYEANHELDASYEAYREALSSPLQDDPSWFAKLSLGLGRVSLEKGQPETAIATLKSALHTNGNDLEILKTLSSAYAEASLREKALWAAKSVLEMTPNDEGNLDWFIQQAISLDAVDKAIDVLKNAQKTDPQSASLLIKLGWLHLYQGDSATAGKIFRQVKELDLLSSKDLYTASQGLLAIEDSANAIEFLDKAIRLGESTGESELLPQIYTSKILAHRMNADLEQALETLDTAISVSPEDHSLVQKKAEILMELEKHQAAVYCIQAGIEKFPQNTDLQLQAAIIHRSNGDLATASRHAQNARDLFATEGSRSLDQASAAMIADLADAMLQPSITREVILEAAEDHDTTTPGDIYYHCIRGELALQSGEEIEAANALTAALETDPDHPRVLALQARLTSPRGESGNANQTLQRGLEAVGGLRSLKQNPKDEVEFEEHPQVKYPTSTYITLAETALAFKEWTAANFLVQKAVALAPKEPRSHFEFARALVLRAEYQRLCQSLDIVQHAPGESALAKFAYKQFEDAILAAAHLITGFNQVSDEISPSYLEAKKTITVWLARGQAVFQPSPEHAEALTKLPETPGNLAAQIATLRYCGNLDEASVAAERIYTDIGPNAASPTLLGQIALSLSQNAPQTALDAVQNAIEVSLWRCLSDRPVYNAIAASIAKQNEDPKRQIQAIQDGLYVWPDEPVWLATAADLLLNTDETEKIKAAIQYLETAAELEPNKVDHYLKLGKAHQRLGNKKGAIVVLDQATRVITKQPEPWLALAKAHHTNRDIPQTIRCAKTVLQIDPKNQPDAYILLAEVSLEVDNAQKASGYIEEILKLHPELTRALLLKAKIYTELNKPEKALSSLEKAIPKLPKSIPLQLQRAQLIQKTDGWDAAYNTLNKLAQENPGDSRILAALSESLSNLNDPGAAIQKAQEAMNCDDGILNLQEKVQLSALLGRLLRKSGQIDQAIHYLTKAIEGAPNFVGPYIELGRCYQEQRLYDRAIKHLQIAIEVAPEDSQPYYFAGLVYKEAKNYVNAERMFKKAAKLSPTNLSIYRQLGAVTAINLVHHHQSKSNDDSQSHMAVPMESME
jgi:tetratricopeptide (TPR) repeat protein